MRVQKFRYAVLISFAALGIATASAVTAPPQPPAGPQRTPLPGNASRGADLYEAKCGACHSLDSNRIGPKHRGVFGRKSATAPGFRYTAALKKLNVVWNRQTLDRWLQSPTAMAPGTAMGYRLTVPQERADVIAYLKQQSPQHSAPTVRVRIRAGASASPWWAWWSGPLEVWKWIGRRV